MNGNVKSNVCCSTENKETIRGLMGDIISESRNLKMALAETHDILFGFDGNPPPSNNDEPSSLGNAMIDVLNTLRACNDIANTIKSRL